MSNTIGHVVGVISIASALVLSLTTAVGAQALQPFDQIQASAVVITPDPSGRAAMLEVDTTIDVACSVIYGTDESFGMIAVDSDMDGGAHADHHPVMGGLMPATAYVYRLQGTAPDGSIYVSEVMSFTTPEVPAEPENLAPGGTVTGVSSEWSEAFAGANAFDGDPTTEWSSQADGDDAWVEIDLGTVQPLAGVEYRTRSMGDGSAITETFTLIADGVTYGPFTVDQPVGLEDLSARVLRFEVDTSTGGNTGAVEILIFAGG